MSGPMSETESPLSSFDNELIEKMKKQVNTKSQFVRQPTDTYEIREIDSDSEGDRQAHQDKINQIT